MLSKVYLARAPYLARMVERFNRSLIQQLAPFTTIRQDDWDEHLLYLLMAYRTSQHGATAYSPALLMYAWELWAPADLGDFIAHAGVAERVKGNVLVNLVGERGIEEGKSWC